LNLLFDKLIPSITLYKEVTIIFFVEENSIMKTTLFIFAEMLLITNVLIGMEKNAELMLEKSWPHQTIRPAQKAKMEIKGPKVIKRGPDGKAIMLNDLPHPKKITYANRLARHKAKTPPVKEGNIVVDKKEYKINLRGLWTRNLYKNIPKSYTAINSK
jgi:hypothetical protein